LEKPRWTNEEYHAISPHITKDELQEFIGRLLKKLYCVAFVLGNVSPTQAKTTLESVLGALNPAPLPFSELARRELVNLAHGKEYIHRIKTYNPEDENSAVIANYQIDLESNLPLLARLELFSQCTSTSSFNQLRTNEQLGYIVGSGNMASCGVAGWRVLVQSHIKGPAHLEERIAAWVASVKKELEEMSTEEFENFRDSLVVAKLEKDKSLSEEYVRWKGEIDFPRARNFDRARQEAEAIEKLEKKDIIQFYDNFIAVGGKQRKKLSILIYGKGQEIGGLPSNCSKDVIEIKDFRDFVTKMPHYEPLFDWSKSQ